MKLTNEDKAKIFMLYPDALVQRFLVRTGEPSGKRDVMLNGLDVITQIANNGERTWFYKLMLHSLSEITDDHKVLLIKEVYYRHVKFEDPYPISLWDDEWFKTVWQISYEAADILRELGYALPWQGHSLFTLGIATTKSK